MVKAGGYSMKKSEVNALVKEIVDYSNECLGRAIAEMVAEDSQVKITRDQAQKIIAVAESTVNEAAFTILAQR